jgi:hypothetical protein
MVGDRVTVRAVARRRWFDQSPDLHAEQRKVTAETIAPSRVGLEAAIHVTSDARRE